MQATDCDKEVARETLEKTSYDVKLAILMILTGLELEVAKQQLKKQDGFLRKAVEHNQSN
jgi:N-acetylmuramic acid 6-phosphate etherase